MTDYSRLSTLELDDMIIGMEEEIRALRDQIARHERELSWASRTLANRLKRTAPETA